MVEDRHYLTEPRPCPGLDLPSWEVDVMREGVPEAIMTIVIDNNILPPRKGKGKKVAWKLPDNIDTQPKLGVQDKKRIMEIFKERKKEMKKQKKRASAESTLLSSPFADQSNNKNSSSKNNNSESQYIEQTNIDGPTKSGENNGVTSSSQIGHLSELSNDHLEQCGQYDNRIRPHPASSIPPGLNSLAVSGSMPAELMPSQSQHSCAQHLPQKSSSLLPPPGLLPPPHPPGLDQATSRPVNAAPIISPPPGLMTPIAPVNSITACGSSTSTGPSTNSSPLSHQHQLPPISPGRCFVVSHVIQSTTDPNAIAKLIAEAYYLLLSRNMIDDLNSYYTPHAQRSLTVGGASHVCVSSVDRRLQLQSLTEMTFTIKGVLQQPSISQSILVSITGVGLKPLPHDQLSPLPFCHTLLLVPVRAVSSVMGRNGDEGESGRKSLSTQFYDLGFQIQNDGLCFLTATDVIGQHQA